MPRFVPAHAEVTAPGSSPGRWMLILHGLLGSGANWRTFARRLAVEKPGWGFVLVDLRMHGQSQDAPPPHTIDAAADDLVRLGAALGRPIDGVLGHSLGGKVALAYAGRAQPALEVAWILDASPSTREAGGSSTEAVLALLRELPPSFATRDEFVQAVLARGQPRSIADWLAMNLRSQPAGDLRFRLDLDAMDALLTSYRTTDLWPVLEGARGAKAFHVVVAGRSEAFSPADRARLGALARRDARIVEHVVPDAGHWVHVDAPELLLQLASRSLS